ncbi:unnamed protein product [Amoebophrya sp. A120]|nr:unnamed protein product [Amoebophrya sp. A120]|eukprot:GSA120T00022567001.1
MCPLVQLYALLLCFTCCLAWRIRANKVKQWDKDLRKWQFDFNQALAPFGLFAKTQTFAWMTLYTDGDGQLQRGRITRRWIALALTPEQSQRLAMEPHISGDVAIGTWCSGLNELELCMHPPQGMYC